MSKKCRDKGTCSVAGHLVSQTRNTVMARGMIRLYRNDNFSMRDKVDALLSSIIFEVGSWTSMLNFKDCKTAEEVDTRARENTETLTSLYDNGELRDILERYAHEEEIYEDREHPFLYDIISGIEMVRSNDGMGNHYGQTFMVDIFPRVLDTMYTSHLDELVDALTEKIEAHRTWTNS